MGSNLSNDELSTWIYELSLEDKRPQPGSIPNAEIRRQGGPPTETEEIEYGELEEPEPEIPGPGPEADVKEFPLSTYEEGEQKDRAPSTTAKLIKEEFADDHFEATYEFKTGQDYNEELPLIAHLGTDEIERVLEQGQDDLRITVSGISNGLLVTAEYDEPNSATEAVYEVNKVVDTLDQISDQAL